MNKVSLKDMKEIFRKLESVDDGKPTFIFVHPNTLTVEDFKKLPAGYQVKLIDEYGQLIDIDEVGLK